MHYVGDDDKCHVNFRNGQLLYVCWSFMTILVEGISNFTLSFLLKNKDKE